MLFFKNNNAFEAFIYHAQIEVKYPGLNISNRYFYRGVGFSTSHYVKGVLEIMIIYCFSVFGAQLLVSQTVTDIGINKIIFVSCFNFLLLNFWVIEVSLSVPTV